jgi:hypothetical protein
MTLHRPPRRAVLLLAAACAALGALTLWLTWPGVNAAGPTTASADTARIDTPFKVEPAKNPTRLFLHEDGARVVGWVSGSADLAGQVVEISPEGKDRVKVRLDKGNTFTWTHEAAKPTAVSFRIDLRDAGAGELKDGITVSPGTAEATPSVFFVVDRTAYRPTQTFHYAGFLRSLDAGGEFRPIANREVEIQLASEKKGTRAFKVKTTSDEFGRITGSYTFTEADALDHYLLSVKDFKGSARVLLGEYRKSKIRLKINGTVKEEKLKLMFEVLDFLEKRVAASKASFTAQVVRTDGKGKTATLKAEDFVYHTSLNTLFPAWEEMPEDEMLLWQGDGPGAALFLGGTGSAVVSQLSGDVEMKEKEVGEYSIDLKKDWLAGGHSIIVSGVVTDANGREQRSTQTIPIGEAKCPGVSLELTRSLFSTNEKVIVRAKRNSKEEAKDHAFDGPLTLVVMKLAPGGGSAPVYDLYGYGLHGYNNLYYGGYSSRYRARRYGSYWSAPAAETVKRSMVTAIPFNRDDAATVKISEPGAYKLVAVGQREDGSNVRTEVGCVVRHAEDLPALTLKLDRDEFTAGEALTGIITSRYANARLLLTVRDSTGLRLWKPLTLNKYGTLRIHEPLPADLRYGCSVEIQYADSVDRIAYAEKFVRVVPADRFLTITPTLKPTVAPGETVKIDFKVDREEEVDLVVSVYDQSLLGIAADKSPDVKNFYLADERVRESRTRDLLRRRLGNVTLEQLVKKAEDLLKTDKKLPGTPEGERLQTFASNLRANYFNSYHMTTALHLAGIETMVNPAVVYYQGYNWRAQYPAPAGLAIRLSDVFDQRFNDWRLTGQMVNDVLILTESHPTVTPRAYMLSSFSPYQNSLGGYGGYGFARSAGRFIGNRDLAWQVSGNSMHSVEGQAMLSHLPQGGPMVPELLNTDPDQSHIGVRRDFSDSAFWNAKVRTDKTGRASVEFKLPDSLTNWQVVVTGVSKKMHVGQARASFRTFKPIMVWPMIPRVYTEGDIVELFGSVHNRTDEPQQIRVKLKVENGEVLSAPEKVVVVPSMSNVPVYWKFKALKAGFTQLLMTADCRAGNDASLKRLPVSRAAAAQIVTVSGMVKDETSFEIPRGVDLKSAALEVNFAPSLAADMADTLNFLVDYPYGCVEQTMSRFLPAIKVAQVLQNFDVDHQELKKKLPGCVAGGLKRLLELQQPDGGWGWNGNGQTHEMMTPYALYGLLQAEKAGYQIPSEQAVERGLNRLQGFITAMNEAQTADRIYCMYVYSHRRDIVKEWWDFVAAQLKKDKLSDYALALALEMAVDQKKKELADDLAAGLRARVKKVGSHRFWVTAGFSRWGEDRFEVTAAAMKALVAYDRTDPLIDGILGFFAATKRGDRWNSTKDTAMILYAMCDYLAKERFDPKAKHELTFAVNGGEARKVKFDNKLTQKFVLAADGLKEGTNRLFFRTTTTGMMYRVVFRYWKTGSKIKPMDEGITVTRYFYLLDDKGNMKRRLTDGDSVPRGSYVLSEVAATNRLGHDMRYVLVDNPKPAGAEILPVEDARFAVQMPGTPYVLREERTASVAFHHEQTPAALNDRCVLLTELAGEYVVPPAHVEMMYQTDHRGHSGTFVLKVVDEKSK